MEEYYGCIVPRLNGADIRKDFTRLRRLVKRGIAGFIIFGGKLSEVRVFVRRLQAEARLPLIISSDLERGAGQQLRGGTLFPPAMALASAVAGRATAAMTHRSAGMLRAAFSAVAEEARYAGINTVFAPVLDINTNPRNPIIATRAFGEDEATVSYCGIEMIRTLQAHGIAACGKHFPGHGDTAVDSHIGLPSIDRSLRSLCRRELVPFIRAAEAGVSMLMLGHLSVPALDPSGLPVSLSGRAVGYIRRTMRYDGMLITDAMNMGGIGRFSEEEACACACEAGVDILLHPSDPEKVAGFLARGGISTGSARVDGFRASLSVGAVPRPEFSANRALAETLTIRAVRGRAIPRLKRIFLVVLNDDEEDRGLLLLRRLRSGGGLAGVARFKRGESVSLPHLPADTSIVVAVFSEIRAWKGGASGWFHDGIRLLSRSARVMVSFGSPYILNGVCGPGVIQAFWDAPVTQWAVAEMLLKAL